MSTSLPALWALIQERRPIRRQMPWMDSFLEQGLIAGKILCPNGRCAAKLGNYAWAGVRCGCKEWITPASLGARSHHALVFADHVLSTRSGILHLSIQGRRDNATGFLTTFVLCILGLIRKFDNGVSCCVQGNAHPFPLFQWPCLPTRQGA
jgi:hypothetical protein